MIEVSILCITYNQGQYLEKALQGIVEQNFPFNMEILICDDNSTDNTEVIIRKMMKRTDNIVYIKNKKNIGALSNLKKGIDKCHGKYIAICEGDDYWIKKNKLLTQYKLMENNQECTFCFHNAKIINETGLIVNDFFRNNYLHEDIKYGCKEIWELGSIPTASYFFRKDAITELPSWFIKGVSGDFVLEQLATYQGYALYIDDIMSVYRKNQKSITGKATKSRKNSIVFIEKNIDTITSLQSFLKDNEKIYEKRLIREKFKLSLLKGKIFSLLLKRNLYSLKELDNKEKICFLLEGLMPVNFFRMKKIIHSISKRFRNE